MKKRVVYFCITLLYLVFTTTSKLRQCLFWNHLQVESNDLYYFLKI